MKYLKYVLIFSLFLLTACYESKVSLEGKIEIDKNLIGRWKLNFYNSDYYYQISKLNNFEYLLMNQEGFFYTEPLFLSKIN